MAEADPGADSSIGTGDGANGSSIGTDGAPGELPSSEATSNQPSSSTGGRSNTSDDTDSGSDMSGSGGADSAVSEVVEVAAEDEATVGRTGDTVSDGAPGVSEGGFFEGGEGSAVTSTSSDTDGAATGGTEGSGSGSSASGVEASGVEASGVEASGVEASGVEASGVEASTDGELGDSVGDLGGEPGSTGLTGRAFDIMIPESEMGRGCAGRCSPATLLVTAETDTTLEVVWGGVGRATAMTLVRDVDGWILAEPLVLGSGLTWEYAWCEDQSVLTTAIFDFGDHDSDGDTDLLIIGHEVSRSCSDDSQLASEGDVTLTGAPDRRAPAILGDSDAMEPIHGIALELDKPLEASATAMLVPASGGSPIELTPRVMDGYVVGFDTAMVLPLGSQFATSITGSDLAGVGTPSSIEVAIVESTGTLAEDGFESGSTAGIHEAEVVDSYGVPAITGERMLHIAPGATALLELDRAEGEGELVMDARWLAACRSDRHSDPLEVAVGLVGTSEVSEVTIDMGTTTTEVSVGQYDGEAGEVQSVTVPLPKGGEEVLVYVHGDHYAGGTGCSQVGLLLDNIAIR